MSSDDAPRQDQGTHRRRRPVGKATYIIRGTILLGQAWRSTGVEATLYFDSGISDSLIWAAVLEARCILCVIESPS